MKLVEKDFGVYHDEDRGGENKYTAFIKWDKNSGIEEIDVVAESDKHAREVVKAVLEKDYLPGGKIIKLQYRVPGMIYF